MVPFFRAHYFVAISGLEPKHFQGRLLGPGDRGGRLRRRRCCQARSVAHRQGREHRSLDAGEGLRRARDLLRHRPALKKFQWT